MSNSFNLSITNRLIGQIDFTSDHMRKVNITPDITILYTLIPAAVLSISINLAALILFRSLESNFVYRMIIYDSFNNILFAIASLYNANTVGHPLPFTPFCSSLVAFCFGVNTFNKLVPIIIVLYRYINVCHAVWAYKKSDKRIAAFLFKACCFLTAVTMCSTMYYSNKMDTYNECMGKLEVFLYTVPNFLDERSYSVNRIDLPLFSPYRFFMNLQLLSFVIIVPILYLLIYISRRNHDMSLSGISEEERAKRMTTNTLSTKIIFLSWLIEFGGANITVWTSSLNHSEHFARLQNFKLLVSACSTICCIMGVTKFREKVLEFKRNQLQGVFGAVEDLLQDNRVYDLSF